MTDEKLISAELRGMIQAHADSLVVLSQEEYRASIRQQMSYEDRTCLSYWYPKIKDFVRTPVTRIIQTDIPLVMLADNESPEGFDDFIAELAVAATSVGTPCFLRTGQTSNKHYWKRTCLLADLAKLKSHVYELVEFSEICDFMGLPSHTWVVRELLPTDPAFTAFHGEMPVTKERRYFVSGNAVVCHHPYWPERSIEQPSVDDWKARLELLNHESEVEVSELTKLSSLVGERLGGDWSIDWLWTKRGWYLTDMAEAHKSFHWDDCLLNKWK